MIASKAIGLLSKRMLKAGALRAKMPTWIAPQLAQLSAQAPGGTEWVHEVKFDGYRILAWVNRGRVTLLTRNRLDWSSKFPALCAEISERVSAQHQLIFDGELCVIDQGGQSSFALMQQSFKAPESSAYVYYVFDLLYLNGLDCRPVDLLTRKSALADLLRGYRFPSIRWSSHTQGAGPEILEEARKLGWEGIISKRGDAPYLSRRSAHWKKIKCIKREEFVILGFTPFRADSKSAAIGALLLGYPEHDRMIYCGKVGTGFDSAERHELFRLLSAQTRINPQVVGPSAGVKGARWVHPTLVAQVEFTEWTPDHRLRHPSFLGLRGDKLPQDVTTTPARSV